MKRVVTTCVGLLAVASALSIAGPVAASPPDAGTCIACHPIDAGVVVGTSFQGCAGTGAVYVGTVGKPYGVSGYGLFRVSDSVKLRSGYGSLASFTVAPNTSFSFQGVSAATMALGGANSVEFTSPNCQVTCTDADGDGYYAESVGCGSRDCNDADAGLNPGASEVRFDGIDQDCNGHDLTTDITRAEWSMKRRRLTVEATSSLGANAALRLDPYGAMTYHAKTGTWSKVVKVSGNGGSATVSGLEGSLTFPVLTVR